MILRHFKTYLYIGMQQVFKEKKYEIEDISQTIVQGNFTMMMVCDLGNKISVAELADVLDRTGEETGVVIRVQHEDIFNAMHSL